MKSKLLSRALAVAASAAMLATMATTAFAAEITTKLTVGGDNYTGKSYSAVIGSSFTVDAMIYSGIDDKTSSTDAKVSSWDMTYTTVVTTTKSSALFTGTVAGDYTTVTGSTTPTDTGLAGLTYTDNVNVASTVSAETTGLPKGEDYASWALVAGSDTKSVKVTPIQKAPDSQTKYYVADPTGTAVYYKQVTSYVVKLVATPVYGTASNTPTDVAITLAITDNRFSNVAYDSTTSGTSLKFDTTNPTAATKVEDGKVTSINIGDKTQVTYELLQAIYNTEDAVDLIQGDITYTIDGIDMDSFASSAIKSTNVMTLSVDAGKLSRTVRNNIADAAKEYGADFGVAIPEDADDYDYYPLDLSDITIPDEVGSVAVTFDPDELYDGGDLADVAADGELYVYLYDDGEFTPFTSFDTTGRRDSLLTFSVEDGDQGLYILTTTKLEKGAASSSSSAPASSTPASSTPASSETIPNTGDANVVAIAVMMAVIALGGAAVVAKKATK